MRLLDSNWPGSNASINFLNRACHGAVSQDLFVGRAGAQWQWQTVTEDKVVDVPGNYAVTNDVAGAIAAVRSAGYCTAEVNDGVDSVVIPTTDQFGRSLVLLAMNQTQGTTTVAFSCQRRLRPQIEAVTSDTDLVLLAIGANDMGLEDIVNRCFRPISIPGFPGRDKVFCEQAITNANRDLPAYELALTNVLNELSRLLHPGARVVLVGYPEIDQTDNFELPRPNFWPPEPTYRASANARALGRALDGAQRRAVQAINASRPGFALFSEDASETVKMLFSGHVPDLDGEGLVGSDWIFTFDPVLNEHSVFESYHPNPDGHWQLARLLTRIDGERAFFPEPFRLSQPRVDPPTGSTAQTFVFRVNYDDPKGAGPDVAQVTIDNISYTLTPESGTLGSRIYRYGPTSLPAGTHSYYFTFLHSSDGFGETAAQQFAVGAAPATPTGRDVRVVNASVDPHFAAPGSTVTLRATVENVGNQAETVTVHWSLVDPFGTTISVAPSVHSIAASTGSTGVLARVMTTTSAQGAWTAQVRAVISADDRPNNNTVSMPLTVGPSVNYPIYRTRDVFLSYGDSSAYPEETGLYSVRATAFYSQEVQVNIYKGTNPTPIASSSLRLGDIRTFDGGQYRIYVQSRASNGDRWNLYHGRPPTATPFTYAPHNLTAPQGSGVTWRVQATSGQVSNASANDILGNPTVAGWYNGFTLNAGSVIRRFDVPPDAAVRVHDFYLVERKNGDNAFYIREARFQVVAGHDASLSQMATGAGAVQVAGSPVQVSATVQVANGYTETVALSLSVTGPGNYLYTDTQSATVTGSRTVALDRAWPTAGLVPGAYTLTLTAGVAGDIAPANDTVSTQVTLFVETPPGPPVLTSAVSATPTSVDLAWTDASSNENGFRVERSLDGTSWQTVCSVSAGATSCVDSGVVAGTAYFYQVVAFNGAGSRSSNVLWLTTLRNSSLTWLYPNGGQQLPRGRSVLLGWSSQRVGGTVRVILLRGGQTVSVLNDAAPNTGSLAWLIPLTTPVGADYLIRIEDPTGAAPPDLGDGPFAIVEAEHYLGVYSNVTGASIAVTPADLTGQVGGTAPLLRWYRPGAAVTLTAPDVVGGRAFQNWRLQDGSTSANRVLQVTIGSDQDVLATYATGVVSSPGPFGKSSPLNGTSGASTTPTLAWTSSSGATTYEYCYATSTAACSNWAPTANGATSVTLPPLAVGTTYYWQVKARNASAIETLADGSASAYWSFTTATPTCSVTLNPLASALLPVGGGPGNFAVQTQPGCSWSAAASDPSWIHLTPQSYGATWTPSTAVGTAPSPRNQVTSQYDAANDRLIISGGNNYGALQNDVWVLADATSPAPTWTQLAPQGAVPPIRQGHVSGYDPATNRLVIHGGWPGLADTWVLTNSNGVGGAPQWTALPSASRDRTGASAAYDAASNRLIVFGGLDVDYYTTQGWYNDVWVLVDANGVGNPQWQQLQPTGTPPAPRYYAGTAYDPTSNRLILVGGAGQSGYLGDVWVLTNANGLGGTPAWISYPAVGPEGRSGQHLAYDPATKRAVMVAGSVASAPALTRTVWVLENADGTTGAPTWRQLTNNGADFGGNSVAGLGYSSSSGTVVLALGAIGTGYRNDVWTAQISAAAPNGTGPGLVNYTVGANSGVGGRSGSITVQGQVHTVTQAGAQTRVIGLSGNLAFGTIALGTTIGRVMTIANTGNSPLVVTGITYPAGYSGNWTSGTVPAGGTQAVTVTFAPAAAIAYNGTINVQANQTGGAPTIGVSGTGFAAPGPFGKALPSNGASGALTTPTLSWASSSGATSYEYCYATSTTTCSNWAPTAGGATSVTLPPLAVGTTYYWQVKARNASSETLADGSASAYWSFTTDTPTCSVMLNPLASALLSAGGAAGNFAVQTQPGCNWSAAASDPSWIHLTPQSYGATWTPSTAVGTAPSPRNQVTSQYDAANDRLIIAGGNNYGALQNDVWVLNDATSAAPAWTQLAPQGTQPPVRQGHVSGYDPATNRLVIHGGWPGLTDTWVLTNANGLGGPPQWTALPSASRDRTGASAAYDAASNRLIVFGGLDVDYYTTQGWYNDVWVLVDANGIGTPQWLQLQPTGTPPAPRYYAGTAYDPASNRLIVVGGAGQGGYLDDVWVLTHANGLGGTPAWISYPAAGPEARSGQHLAYDPATKRAFMLAGSVASSPNYTRSVWVLENADGTTGLPAWRQATNWGPDFRGNSVAGFGFSVSTGRAVLALGVDGPDYRNDVWTVQTAAAVPNGTGPGVVTYRVDANPGSGYRTGSIEVEGQVHAVNQAGTVEDARIISLSGDLTFGAIALGTTATRVLAIANTGNADLTVTGITYPTGYTGAWSGTLAPGATQNVTVTFAPTAVVNYNGTITVQANQTGGAPTIGVSGSGSMTFTRIIGLSGNLAFGNVAVGTTATRTLTITNTGNDTLLMSGLLFPQGFATMSGSLNIAPGGSTSVSITLTPPTAGAFGGTIRALGTQTSGVDTIPVSGTGIAVAPTTGAIEGQVRNAVTDLPQANVRVWALTAGTSSVVGQATTNPFGGYLISGLAPGNYVLFTTNSLGLVDEVYNNIPCAVSPCDLDRGTPVPVTAGATTANRNFLLDPGGRVTGRVTDAATGAGVAGVQVSLYAAQASGPRFVRGGTSNASGDYTVEGLATGQYFAFTTNAGGYTNEIFDDLLCPGRCEPAVATASGTPIPVTVNTTTAGRHFVLGRGGAISGTVRDAATGNPVPNASLTAVTRLGTRAVETGFAESNASGQYTVSGLPAGTYEVYARADGYAPEILGGVVCVGACRDVIQTSPGTPMVVTVGGTASGNDIALDRGGRIAGVVTEANSGLPIPNVEVEVLAIVDGRLSQVDSVQSNASGVYETRAVLSTGSYVAGAFNNLGFLQELYDNVHCVDGGDDCLRAALSGLVTPIPVSLGATTSGRNFALSQGGTLTGRVTDAATGAPLAGVEVWLYRHTPAGGVRVGERGRSTDANGMYTFRSLTTGSYVAFTANAQGYVDKVFSNVSCESACTSTVALTVGNPIPVTAGGQTSGIDFGLSRRMQPAAPANLRAVVSGFSVFFTWDPPAATLGGAATSYVLEAGLAPGATFVTLPTATPFLTAPGVPAGRYFVRVRAVNGAGAGPASSEIELNVGADGAAPLEPPRNAVAFMSGGRLTLTWEAPAAGGTPSGYVVEAGSAAGLSNIASLPVNGTSFSFDLVPPGYYFLRVRATSATRTSAPSNEVMIAVGGAASPPTAPLALRAAVTGNAVTFDWAAPVTGPVTSYRLEAGSASGLSNIAVLNTGTVGTSISFSGVPSGRYYIRLRGVNGVGVGVASNEVVLDVP